MFLDTTIFIDYLKGRPDAAAAILGARAGGVVPTHAIVVAELFAGSLNRSDLRRVIALASTCRVIVPDEADIRRALRLLERHALSHGVDWNDCLIAASALRLAQPVVTTNDKHFRPFRGLKVRRPY
jgi:predicted nucleic acid-binding protein